MASRHAGFEAFEESRSFKPHHPVFFFRQSILLLITFLQVTGGTCLGSAAHALSQVRRLRLLMGRK